jgi:hypothetical protein
MPLEEAVLTFRYGSGALGGDGANYAVRVNGRTVWHAYRPERRTGPDEGLKPEEAEIDLAEYAARTVVLELVTDGHASPILDRAVWHRPRLRRKEGEPGGGPVLPGLEF